jgi:hypothetical protein
VGLPDLLPPSDRPSTSPASRTPTRQPLERALRTDAAIELVGTRTWFSGRVTCLRYLAHVIGWTGG